jgi:hypothetical protein
LPAHPGKEPAGEDKNQLLCAIMCIKISSSSIVAKAEFETALNLDNDNPNA